MRQILSIVVILSVGCVATDVVYHIDTVAGNGESRLGRFTGDVEDVAISQPFGVEIGPDGALYVCEVGNHRVLRVDLEAVSKVLDFDLQLG